MSRSRTHNDGICKIRCSILSTLGMCESLVIQLAAEDALDVHCLCQTIVVQFNERFCCGITVSVEDEVTTHAVCVLDVTDSPDRISLYY